ncbi:hypothetical protein CDAR_429241, partial [Caerostris darwini]
MIGDVPKRMEQTSFPKAGEKFLLCPLRPAHNNLPRRKEDRVSPRKDCFSQCSFGWNNT